MQTFLPYPDFEQTAYVLDRLRLGKQRVETLQILNTLETGTGWIHHPAVKMWIGYELVLVDYQVAICEEWSRRGYRDTCLNKTFSIYDRFEMPGTKTPPWLGNPDFHASHRSNLLRKDYNWYSKFGWSEPNDLPYLWPV